MEENIKRLKKDNSEYIFQLKKEKESIKETELEFSEDIYGKWNNELFDAIFSGDMGLFTTT